MDRQTEIETVRERSDINMGCEHFVKTPGCYRTGSWSMITIFQIPFYLMREQKSIFLRFFFFFG